MLIFLDKLLMALEDQPDRNLHYLWNTHWHHSPARVSPSEDAFGRNFENFQVSGLNLILLKIEDKKPAQAHLANHRNCLIHRILAFKKNNDALQGVTICLDVCRLWQQYSYSIWSTPGWNTHFPIAKAVKFSCGIAREDRSCWADKWSIPYKYSTTSKNIWQVQPTTSRWRT